MEKSDINLNEYNNMDLVSITWNDGTDVAYDDIVEFSWNGAKDIAEMVDSKGMVIYINMYAVSIMTRYRCGGKPYTVN